MMTMNATVAKLRCALILLQMLLWCMPVEADGPTFQKGICFVSWEKQRYASAYSDEALAALASTGAEWVQVVVTCYQEHFDSKEILATEKTPSDRSLRHVIRKAHSLGLKVMLKPHLDLLDESGTLCRSDIGFQNVADWRGWFREYLGFILRYAQLAQEESVELFCIGTELSFASQQTEFWINELIPAVRSLYRGGLTYAANWDEYRRVGFWRELDYVGIDAYFPLAQEVRPAYETLKAAWRKWADEIEEWQKGLCKSVIFTEIGYRSCDRAAARPWEFSSSEAINLGIQSDCYQAALQALSGRSWCRGIYWWYWKATPHAGGLCNREFTPQNKPAEIVLSYWYKGAAAAYQTQN